MVSISHHAAELSDEVIESSQESERKLMIPTTPLRSVKSRYTATWVISGAPPSPYKQLDLSVSVHGLQLGVKKNHLDESSDSETETDWGPLSEPGARAQWWLKIIERNTAHTAVPTARTNQIEGRDEGERTVKAELEPLSINNPTMPVKPTCYVKNSPSAQPPCHPYDLDEAAVKARDLDEQIRYLRRTVANLEESRNHYLNLSHILTMYPSDN
ncbi:hypothetical protein CPB84DRAFT_1850917 [Gymnopilus junonius]|uniref:Uncharacterized protein n=1 Tax=Gymnopilus junonius TaxID=109634 RepID=A0A9P5NGK1_GYMJU|nr:hypothetical protein CPB84DRAFT_1850917 [Gymnopilus junonius]